MSHIIIVTPELLKIHRLMVKGVQIGPMPLEEKSSAMSHSSPPLLQAALKGSLASVEWFLSDMPTRQYLEFAGTHK